MIFIAVSWATNEILWISEAVSQIIYEIVWINEAVSYMIWSRYSNKGNDTSIVSKTLWGYLEKYLKQQMRFSKSMKQYLKQYMRFSESTKQYLKHSSIGGNTSKKTPFGGDLMENLCRGKSHKRLFRVTSSWGATTQRRWGISFSTIKLKYDLLGNNSTSTCRGITPST